LTTKEIWSIAVKASGTPFPAYGFPMWAMYALCWSAEHLNWLIGMETVATVAGLRLSRVVEDFDNTKARRELQWNPRPVEESIAEAACWFYRSGRRSRRRAREAIQREPPSP
jgi:dihydroflavonol-4-reductase